MWIEDEGFVWYSAIKTLIFNKTEQDFSLLRNPVYLICFKFGRNDSNALKFIMEKRIFCFEFIFWEIGFRGFLEEFLEIMGGS